MLSREDNALVTRVGPETPLGRLMRRYWLPALLAREIAEPDGPPGALPAAPAGGGRGRPRGPPRRSASGCWASP